MPLFFPHAAKQRIIEELAKLFSCELFIETGTYLGDTIFSQKGNFKKIISIELAKKLYKWAARRFKNILIFKYFGVIVVICCLR